MSWPVYALGPLIEADGGLLQTGPFGSQLKQAEYTEYGIPVIMPKDIENGRVNTKTVARVPEATADRLSRHKIRAYGIVLPRRGAISKRAFIRPNQEGWLCGTGCIKIEATGRRIWPKYLYYYMGAIESVSWLEKNAVGSTMLNLSAEIVSRFPLACPAIEVQQHIADVLSAYDDLIENNRRRIALLEEATRLLYREWFVHFRFPGHEQVKIINGLPEGWETRYLREVVTTQYGHTASASDREVGPKFVRGMDINKQSFIEWSSVPYCPEHGLDFNKYELVPGDILAIRMADPGKVAIVEKPIRAVFASYLVRFKIRNPDEVPPIFLFMTLIDERYQGFIGASSGGSTRKSASAKLLTDFHFVLPPKDLLELFVEQVVPVRKMITKLSDQAAYAAKARDLLLPRLMNGEIAV